MKLSLITVLTALACRATSTPVDVGTLVERQSGDFCGQWDLQVIGSYTVYNNLWNQNAGTGSQCTGVDGLSGTTLSWHTTWSWAQNPSNVKSYANAVVSLTPRRLYEVKSIPATWRYTYTGNNLVANVAFDLFTASSSSTNAKHEYEIMIWLNALGGAGPISATGSPIATRTIAGVQWRLFYGLNGDMKVFSFVASNTVTNFSGNLNDFLIYLRDNQGMPQDQYLLSLGGGTEPFTGSNANFRTSAYSVVVQ